MFHGSEQEIMNKKQKEKCTKFGYTQWWYVPSTVKSRMTELELMTVFGRYQSRNMQFDHINNMLRIAMAKMDVRKQKFQITMIQCFTEVLKNWIADVKLPGLRFTSCLDLVTNICMNQLEDFAIQNDEEFNTQLAKQIIETYIIETYINGGVGTDTNAIDFVNDLNLDGHFSKHESAQNWVKFLAAVKEKIRQTEVRQKQYRYGTKQELKYIWRLGRIMFGGQATLSSTLQLERTFSLLMLNLEKRRFNLGERQHSCEARIMIFIKNAAKTKEVLEEQIFDVDNNRLLKAAYSALIPWDYSTNIDEETDDKSLLDDSVEKETSDDESQSHNWPSQSDGGRKSSNSQSDGGRKTSTSQSDGGRKTSNRRSTTQTQRDTSQKVVYSSEPDKSFDILNDGSIANIYDNSNDVIPTGNGRQIDTITELVRYPF